MTDRNTHSPGHNWKGESNPNGIEWLAFCYVHDELDTAATAEFESRLESDELAQQAVVEAVQQSQVLYMALDSTSSDVNREQVVLAPRPAGALARISPTKLFLAASAAVLLFVAGWAWLGQPSNSDLDSDQLAAAWVESLAVMTDEELNEELAEAVDEESLFVDFEDADSDEWMLVALTDLESEGDESDAY